MKPSPFVELGAPSVGESEQTPCALEILLPSGAQLSRNEVAALLAEHDERTGRCGDLERQVEWFKKQIFGSKSERRIVGADGRQLWLGQWGQPSTDSEGVTVGGHTRRRRGKEKDDASELRFDETVRVEEIRI